MNVNFLLYSKCGKYYTESPSMNFRGRDNFSNFRKAGFNKTQNCSSSVSTGQKTDVYPYIQVQKPKKIWYEKTISELYDTVYERVLKENPVIEELGILKPDMVLLFNENADELSSYNIFSNSIYFETSLNRDFYLYIKRNKSGDITDIKGPMYKQDVNLDETIEEIKLTEEEKELYIASAIAHELRHCIQKHMELSTEGCEEFQSRLKGDERRIQEIVRIAREAGYSEKEIGKLAKVNGYIEGFQPKKTPDKNALLKFSTNRDDKRYWSIKNHFVEAEYGQKGEIPYLCRPAEIDAFNYQDEYLARYGQTNGVRKKVLEYMHLRFKKYTDFMSYSLDLYGFTPIIEK